METKQDLTTVLVPIDDLIHYEENPRRLMDDGYISLSKKMIDYGWLQPLQVNSNPEFANVVFGGNMRLAVAKDLHAKGQKAGTGEDFSMVPVVYLDISDAAEMAKIALILNGHDGKWDADQLANLMGSHGIDPKEFAELASIPMVDLEGVIGMSMEDLGALSGDIGGEESGGEHEEGKEDEIPEVEKTPVVELGEIWQLGNHRMLCGDCTVEDNMLALMDGKKADMVFTSPPYNGNTHVNGTPLYLEVGMDKKSSEDFLSFNIAVFNCIKIAVKNSGNIFYNISYNKNSRSEYIRIVCNAIDAGFNLHETIVWKKSGTPIPAPNVMTREWEFIFLFNQADVYQTNKEMYGYSTNFWIAGSGDAQRDDHKACFPIALPEKAIIDTSKEKDLILDPFLGSGTTLIAAQKTNRICFGCELDEWYCTVILQRYLDYTGNQPIRLSDGKTFEEVKGIK